MCVYVKRGGMTIIFFFFHYKKKKSLFLRVPLVVGGVSLASRLSFVVFTTRRYNVGTWDLAFLFLSRFGCFADETLRRKVETIVSRNLKHETMISGGGTRGKRTAWCIGHVPWEPTSESKIPLEGFPTAGLAGDFQGGCANSTTGRIAVMQQATVRCAFCVWSFFFLSFNSPRAEGTCIYRASS